MFCTSFSYVLLRLNHCHVSKYAAPAVFNTKRDPELPNVPTLGEKGLYPEWYGTARALVAPKGTKPEVIQYYVEALKKTMQDPAVVEAHKKAGMALDFKDNKELGDLIKAQDKLCS